MPMIPEADQSQAIVAGNPVPIHSAAELGAAGENEAAFGTALFHLGNAMDAVAKHTANESAKIALVDANARFKQKMLYESATQAASAPIDGDKTGVQATQSFADRSQKVRDEIAQGLDPGLQSAFASQADNEIANHSAEVLATEVKKRAANLKPETGAAVSSLSSLARQDSSQIDYSLTKAESMINNSVDIPDASKPQMVRNAKAQIVRDAAQGFADRKQWDQGVAMLSLVSRDRNGNVLNTAGEPIHDANGYAKSGMAGVPASPFGDALDVKEKESIINSLQSEQATYHTRQNQALEFQERQDKRAQDASEKDLVSQYAVALQQAGPDETKRGPILAEINQSMANGELSEAKGVALSRPSQFTKEADDKYAADMKSKLILGTISPGEAAEKVAHDMHNPNGGISYGGANPLLDHIQRIAQNPGLLIPTIKKAQTGVTDAMLDLNKVVSPSEKADLQGKMEKAAQDVQDEIIADPTADHAKAIRQVLQKNFNLDTSDLSGSSPEKVQQQREENFKKNKAKAASGQWTGEDDRQATEEDRRLLYAKTLMLLDRQSQQHQLQNNSGSNVPPAR